MRVVEALERWGHSWLYDVQLLAGQPEGTITDSGSKGWELWTFALHHYFGVPKTVGFNSFVLAIMLGCPVLIYAAARSFSMSAPASLLAATMASTTWFFDSHIHWQWFVGMISWTGAACIAVLTLGLFHRLLNSKQLAWGLPCALCLGAGLLIHPYTFVALAAPMIAIYVRAARTMSAPEHMTVVGVAAFALAVNAYWMLNAAAHWHYILNSAFYAQANPKHLICDLLDVLCSGADTGAIGTRTGFRFLYLGLGIAGLRVWRATRDSRGLPLTVGIFALYACAHLGGFIPGMQQSQPYRQITPATLFTTLPAAAFIESLWRARLVSGLPRAAQALVLVLSLTLGKQLLTSQVMYFFPRVVPEPARHLDGLRSPLSGYGFLWSEHSLAALHYGVPHDPQTFEPGGEEIVSWLSENAQRSARISIDGSVLGERLAWRTGLEVLGGFFERNVAHVDANYFREHRTYMATPEDLVFYLRLFAVDFVVSDRPEFTKIPNVIEHVATPGGHRIYRTIQPFNRVLRGGGVVSARENMIAVTGSDPNQTVVVAYHWHEALRCKPDCRIEREAVSIDRVGFVRVPAPHPPDFSVWNSYESW
jgi:hypothetical protein